MIGGKKIFYLAVVFIGAVAVIAGILFWLQSMRGMPDEEQINSNDAQKIVLRESEGLNIEYPGGSFQKGERLIYERHRLFDETGTYELVGPEGNINISEENAKVTLTRPDGTQEDVTSGSWFFPLRIYPPLAEGVYTLTFNLKTGETYEREIEVKKSEEVDLVATDLTQILEKPQLNPQEPTTLEQRLLLNDFIYGDRESIELKAFKLGDLDLKKATAIHYINPHNTVKNMNTPGFNLDNYFWLDLVKIAEVEQGEHIFLAKIDGAWYYAVANYPEDFRQSSLQ